MSDKGDQNFVRRKFCRRKLASSGCFTGQVTKFVKVAKNFVRHYSLFCPTRYTSSIMVGDIIKRFSTFNFFMWKFLCL